jgi:hypothetical protein
LANGIDLRIGHLTYKYYISYYFGVLVFWFLVFSFFFDSSIIVVILVHLTITF